MSTPLVTVVAKAVVVGGTHKTKLCAVSLTVKPSGNGEVCVSFGATEPGLQWARAGDLRELAAVFTEIADALEDK